MPERISGKEGDLSETTPAWQIWERGFGHPSCPPTPALSPEETPVLGHWCVLLLWAWQGGQGPESRGLDPSLDWLVGIDADETLPAVGRAGKAPAPSPGDGQPPTSPGLGPPDSHMCSCFDGVCRG